MGECKGIKIEVVSSVPMPDGYTSVPGSKRYRVDVRLSGTDEDGVELSASGYVEIVVVGTSVSAADFWPTSYMSKQVVVAGKELALAYGRRSVDVFEEVVQAAGKFVLGGGV